MKNKREERIGEGKSWLRDQGYSVEEEGKMFLCTKDDKTQLVSIRKINKIFGVHQFRHDKAQEYYNRNIKTLWDVDGEFGWNRDWFTNLQVDYRGKG